MASMPPRYGRRLALVKALAVPITAAAEGRVRLLALGDSLTAGYGLPAGQGFVPQLERALAAAGRSVRVLDAGVSGDTTAGGLARIDWAMAERPHAALVALGGNDGLRGLPPAATRRNLAGILDRLAARQVPVLLAGMLAPPNLGDEYGREFAAAFAELAAERAASVLFYPFFLAGVAAEPALNQPDGIHPNAAGVARMVEGVLPLVLRLLDRVVHGG